MVVREYPMLHTKFQGHRSFGSREDDLFYVFTIYTIYILHVSLSAILVK